jgi:GMP synthase (glutamine-hydrolysing)
MRVLAVVHGPLVRPELFTDVIASEGHALEEWDIRLRGAPPLDFDAVMIFGGDQNVGEESAHPWLHEEYDALRHWVGEGTPLLAVCLGAQTLAHALGAQVRPVGSTLAGFYVAELTDEGAADPVLGILPRRFESFNANKYWFEVPAGAVELATGPTPQGFRVDASAWGLQFHPEVQRDQVLKWFEDDPTLPKPFDELAAELDEKLPAWQEHGRAICRAFLSYARTARATAASIGAGS